MGNDKPKSHGANAGAYFAAHTPLDPKHDGEIDMSDQGVHERWVARMVAAGWGCGPYDLAKKEHPGIKQFFMLTDEDKKAKGYLER